MTLVLFVEGGEWSAIGLASGGEDGVSFDFAGWDACFPGWGRGESVLGAVEHCCWY